MKNAWMTALAQEAALGHQVLVELNRYGFAAEGHFWVDDLPSMAWMGVLEKMQEQRPALWVILANTKTLAEPNLRYGISALRLAVSAHLGPLPTAVLSGPQETLTVEMAPPVLGSALYLSVATPTWQAKLVGLANRPAAADRAEYRLDVYGDRQIGQWFEVGPTTGTWQGALFGVAGAEIDFHAVGPPGKPPERTTLSYPQKGLRLEANGVEHTAWALRNPVAVEESYFVRVRGEPRFLVFGPYPEADVTELFTLGLG